MPQKKKKKKKYKNSKKCDFKNILNITLKTVNLKHCWFYAKMSWKFPHFNSNLANWDDIYAEGELVVVVVRVHVVAD